MVQYQEGTGANSRLPHEPAVLRRLHAHVHGAPGLDRVGFADIGTGTGGRTCQLRAWQTDLVRSSPSSGTSSSSGRLTDSTSLNVGYVGQPLDPRGHLPRRQPAAARRRATVYLGTASGSRRPLPAVSGADPLHGAPTPRSTTTASRRACGTAAPTASSSWPPTRSASRSRTTRASTVRAGAAPRASRTPAWAATATRTPYDMQLDYGPPGSRRKHNRPVRQLRAALRQGPRDRQRLGRRHSRRCSAAGT